jgi:hypothetical protein
MDVAYMDTVIQRGQMQYNGNRRSSKEEVRHKVNYYIVSHRHRHDEDPAAVSEKVIHRTERDNEY